MNYHCVWNVVQYINKPVLYHLYVQIWISLYYYILSLTPKCTFCHFTRLLFLCQHPLEEFLSSCDILSGTFSEIAVIKTYAHTDSSNKCKQAESLLSSCSHATFQSTEALHQVCYIHNYVPCVFGRWRVSFAARRRRTRHFQLMCFKSTYFWDCRSGRALLAPVAPALHSDAWRVRCWRSLGLVSIYNSSWWVAVGTHLPVS